VSRDTLLTAYEAVLNDDIREDCVHTVFETDDEEFVIEFGNFSEGLRFNVCHLSSLAGDPFAKTSHLETLGVGDDYAVFDAEQGDAETLVDETLALASTVDGEFVAVKLRNIENMPDWVPEKIVPPWNILDSLRQLIGG